jgi:hypothetical protein
MPETVAGDKVIPVAVGVGLEACGEYVGVQCGHGAVGDDRDVSDGVCWVQVTSERFGDGSMFCCLRIRHTVEAPTRWPVRLSSPAIRR